ncbi:Endonuclease/Exonuclease/phosphatase family protein [Pelagimonas phthalicica]|uniref:Endonuclease/Exonuclease/phosphatase family protein n=1 Tax=Pelagimonas phthalicica TaxID=1037362 RepID=A0A238JCW5_9RHOB|nr:endonuclease/exonuclease/phosphatase family protein [Pelagimonas phthalicica]TDS93800.1 hypothetical protein CLV87_0288 [Pelagimonas phthalicica]SMX27676.1 Endonuclease/Exonuclease/phosphatase family protein [Pelagimonas phthalicica]
MVNYVRLKRRYGYFSAGAEWAKWTSERLLALRAQIARDIPPKSARDTLLIASWNIRDFGKSTFNPSPRLPETSYYIAEILSAFDIIAVQEIGDLDQFDQLMKLMGKNWDYIISDMTEGASGNGERIAFVFDTNRVFTRNVVGEVVLTEAREIGGDATTVKLPAGAQLETEDGVLDLDKGDLLHLPEGQKVVDRKQFARTPFLVAFQAGWFKFTLCSAHIYFGKARGAKYDRRVKELAALARFFKDRSAGNDENYIILGDFNVVSTEDDTMKALLDNGFSVPQELWGLATNMMRNAIYDQIAFRVKEKELEIPDFANHPNAGVFNCFENVFRANHDDGVPQGESFDHLTAETSDFAHYLDNLPPDKIENFTEVEKRAYYWRKWRTWQMSDHMPLWVALKTDFADDYLKEAIELAEQDLAEED